MNVNITFGLWFFDLVFEEKMRYKTSAEKLILYKTCVISTNNLCFHFNNLIHKK